MYVSHMDIPSDSGLIIFQVTPPDTELITVSRTGRDILCKNFRHKFLKIVSPVGVDKVVEEMVFKCTHTTVRSGSRAIYALT